jgi:hypothetical protein
MKGISIALTVVTALLALSQLTCGLWLQSNSGDAASASFHATLGIGVIISTFATLISLWVLAGQRGKAQVK